MRLLQATQTLGATAQHFHWNVKGPHFHSLHEMFGEQYADAIAAQDEIAERVRALGADVPAPPVVSPDTMPAAMMVATLAAMQETGARLAREAAACAESVNDQATIDLVGKVQRDSEKAAWMLRSTLGQQAGAAGAAGAGAPSVLIGMAKAARAMVAGKRAR